MCSSLSHLHVRRGVVSLDVRVDGFLHQTLLKLGLRQLTPHRRLVAALRKLIGSVQVTNVLNENLDNSKTYLGCGQIVTAKKTHSDLAHQSFIIRAVRIH